MKISSIISISAIAASTLLAFSTAALAISQPKNITANIESQSSQISEHPPQMIAQNSDKKNDKKEESPSRVVCPPPFEFLCGWW